MNKHTRSLNYLLEEITALHKEISDDLCSHAIMDERVVQLPLKMITDGIDLLSQCADALPYDPLIVFKTGMYVDKIEQICTSVEDEPRGELCYRYHAERLSELVDGVSLKRWHPPTRKLHRRKRLYDTRKHRHTTEGGLSIRVLFGFF